MQKENGTINLGRSMAFLITHHDRRFFPPLEPHGPAAVGVAERGLKFQERKTEGIGCVPISSVIKMLQEVQRMLILQQPALVPS